MCSMLIQVICKQSRSAILVYDLFCLPCRIKIVGVENKGNNYKEKKKGARSFFQVKKNFII